MSNALAVAAVTRTLRNLLTTITSADYSGLPDDTRPTAEIEVTTLPLDRVRNGDGASQHNQLNLFLYHAEPNTAWRNMDMPLQVRDGETGRPPLALNLYYILTAYGQDDSELVAHVLLGTAMRILHDHPVLGRAEIRTALAPSELDAQFERVHVTPQPVSLDEVSKLWTGFQSEYRLSAAYQVSVVLIESRRRPAAPLPVLRRGEADRGPVAVATPGPSLTAVTAFEDPSLAVQPPHGKPGAELGDVIVLSGNNLGDESLVVRLRHLRLDVSADLQPEAARTDTELRARLPAPDWPGVPAAWPAGCYTIELVGQPPGRLLPFCLGPTLAGLAPATQPTGPFDLTVSCRPQIRPEQRVSVLLGARELTPASISTPADPDSPTTITAPVPTLPPGEYVVRLRVDGADSVPIDFSTTPASFDSAQTVTVTP